MVGQVKYESGPLPSGAVADAAPAYDLSSAHPSAEDRPISTPSNIINETDQPGNVYQNVPRRADRAASVGDRNEPAPDKTSGTLSPARFVDGKSGNVIYQSTAGDEVDEASTACMPVYAAVKSKRRAPNKDNKDNKDVQKGKNTKGKRHAGQVPSAPLSRGDEFVDVATSAAAAAETASGQNVYAKLMVGESRAAGNGAAPSEAAASDGAVYARLASRGHPESARSTKVLTLDKNAGDAGIGGGLSNGISRSGRKGSGYDGFDKNAGDAGIGGGQSRGFARSGRKGAVYNGVSDVPTNTNDGDIDL